MCWNLWSNSFACLECRVQGVSHASLAESCQSIFCTNVSFARSRTRIVSALNTHSNCNRAVDRERKGEQVREVKLLATKALVATKPEAAIRLSCCRATATGWQRVHRGQGQGQARQVTWGHGVWVNAPKRKEQTAHEAAWMTGNGNGKGRGAKGMKAHWVGFAAKLQEGAGRGERGEQKRSKTFARWRHNNKRLKKAQRRLNAWEDAIFSLYFFSSRLLYISPSPFLLPLAAPKVLPGGAKAAIALMLLLHSAPCNCTSCCNGSSCCCCAA